MALSLLVSLSALPAVSFLPQGSFFSTQNPKPKSDRLTPLPQSFLGEHSTLTESQPLPAQAPRFAHCRSSVSDLTFRPLPLLRMFSRRSAVSDLTFHPCPSSGCSATLVSGFPLTVQAHSWLRGFLPALFLAETPLPQLPAWLPLSPPWGLCSNITSSVKASLFSFKPRTASPPNFSPWHLWSPDLLYGLVIITYLFFPARN